MTPLKDFEVWFITGSQHLYGEEVLKNVQLHSEEIAAFLGSNSRIPVSVKFKLVATSPEAVTKVLGEASSDPKCIGLILWMHTFSPAKMWINGLRNLIKPFVHLHTQYNSEIPWETIDMDFMNENQSAHGDREFGYITARMRKPRKIIVGYWKDEEVVEQIDNWSRAAAGWHTMNNLRVARIGDNMREVAVTEGDKVEAQIRWGVSVNGYGVGDLVKYVDEVSDSEVEALVTEYCDVYEVSSEVEAGHSIRDAARIEIGLRRFLIEGNFQAFTDTFEDLHGLKQLPGIAVQRLMHDGYGFGAEGDWKTAAMVHTIKVMGQGLDGGSSFMEDYTYDIHNSDSTVLGAHMLEICPSIANGKPRCEVHPLSIGGKEDPARLIFDAKPGPAINVSVIDMGNRFRMLLNTVTSIEPKNPLPKLPVARVLWNPHPNWKVAAEAWIRAGGAHHTVFSSSVTKEIIEDLAEMAGMELLVIDKDTEMAGFKDRLRWNEIYYHQNQNNL